MEDTAEPIVPESQPEPSIPRTNDLTGRTLGGDFFLERRIGQGGMGQVYLAKQISLKRQVAVKILRTDLAANVTALQRFRLEAEAVARITHANIVQVYAIGEDNGLHFMALEYVEGRNLRDYLVKKGPPELPVAINLLRQIAAALHRAHELGFVHRDIKPENILLTRKAEVKVTDFGLSRCFSSEQPLHITQSGVTMGTPLYMSPEQVQGHTVDPRSDIYSFGVTAYHLLAGEPPFKGNTPFEVAVQHVQNEPRRLEEFGIPVELAAIVHKMMAKKPSDRYQTSREVLRELTRYRESMAMTHVAGFGTGAVPYPAGVVQTGSAVPPMVGATTAVATLPRHRPYLLVLGLLLIAGAGVAGAFLHKHLHPTSVVDESPTNQGPIPTVLDGEAIATKAREKELLKRLDDKSTKSDVLIDSLLELTQIYLRDRRFDDATKLFEKDLFDRPTLRELVRGLGVVYPQAPQLINKLGMGIILAHRDMDKESLESFAVVMPKIGASKDKKLLTRPVDVFLRKYPEWSRAVADALDRDAKNLGGKLDDPFPRYRSYSKQPDR